MPSSRGSSWLRDGTHVSCTGGQILYRWATGKPISHQATPLKLNLIKLSSLHFHAHSIPFAWNVFSFFYNWPNSLSVFLLSIYRRNYLFSPTPRSSWHSLSSSGYLQTSSDKEQVLLEKLQPQQKPKEQQQQKKKNNYNNNKTSLLTLRLLTFIALPPFSELSVLLRDTLPFLLVASLPCSNKPGERPNSSQLQLLP